jgi:indolepyruvate ferredoxin oxidoreductase
MGILDARLIHYLAPPLLGKTGADGKPVKATFDPWIRSAFGLMVQWSGFQGLTAAPRSAPPG